MSERLGKVICKEVNISTLVHEVVNNQCNFNNGNMVKNVRVESKYCEDTTTSIFVEKDHEVFFLLVYFECVLCL